MGISEKSFRRIAQMVEAPESFDLSEQRDRLQDQVYDFIADERVDFELSEVINDFIRDFNAAVNENGHKFLNSWKSRIPGIITGLSNIEGVNGQHLTKAQTILEEFGQALFNIVKDVSLADQLFDASNQVAGQLENDIVKVFD